MAIVTRAYEGPPIPPAANAPDPKAPPVIPKVTITLNDTGMFPAYNGLFHSHSPGGAMLGGLPVIRATGLPPGSESVQVWVGKRFIVKIFTENLPAGAVEQWLKSIKLDELKNLAPTGSHTLPYPITMYRIDELKPQNNSSFPLSWTTEEAVEKTSQH